MLCDFQNAEGRRAEEPSCGGEPVIIQILDKADTHVGFEKFHKVGRAEITEVCHLRNGDRFRIMGLYVSDDIFQLFQHSEFRLCRNFLISVGNQQVKKLKKISFQGELISFRLCLAQGIHLLDKRQDGFITG